MLDGFSHFSPQKRTVPMTRGYLAVSSSQKYLMTHGTSKHPAAPQKCRRDRFSFGATVKQTFLFFLLNVIIGGFFWAPMTGTVSGQESATAFSSGNRNRGTVDSGIRTDTGSEEPRNNGAGQNPILASEPNESLRRIAQNADDGKPANPGIDASVTAGNSSDDAAAGDTITTESRHAGSSDVPDTKPESGLEQLMKGPDYWVSDEGIKSSLKTFLLLTVLSLAPSIFVMTTSFVRIMTVLSILRQAIGTGQLPPGQVLTALALFMTMLIMMPVWTEVYENAVVPYSSQEIPAAEAFDRGQLPIRTFMWKQIERTDNTDTIWMLMRYVPEAKTPEYYEEIPWRVLLPAFMLSELKTAFLIGFQLFIPFLIIDMVVSCIMVSMGMMMLPPVLISLPFKLLLFVLMDGWTLIVKMLLDSFSWYFPGG